jgi:hypothetical protein
MEKAISFGSEELSLISEGFRRGSRTTYIDDEVVIDDKDYESMGKTVEKSHTSVVREDTHRHHGPRTHERFNQDESAETEYTDDERNDGRGRLPGVQNPTTCESYEE